MLTNKEIQIRDPYIFVNKDEGSYYLYGSTDKNIWGKGTGFDLYIGKDLEHWEGPFPVFRPTDEFFSDENYWAPEVHEYKGRYYMFATFLRKDNGKRGTAILVSDKLTGPFVPHSDGPVTPKGWFSLDGTLHIDKDNKPWIVFCHEWVQIGIGSICAQRLTDDLSQAVGEPIELFQASDAPWPTAFTHRRFPDKENYVTDGPFVFRDDHGDLLMLWASFVHNIYAQGISRSLSGDITGPWKHENEPLYTNDGGHGMIFRDLQEKWKLTLHSPNKTPKERPIFVNVAVRKGELFVKK